MPQLLTCAAILALSSLKKFLTALLRGVHTGGGGCGTGLGWGWGDKEQHLGTMTSAQSCVLQSIHWNILPQVHTLQGFHPSPQISHICPTTAVDAVQCASQSDHSRADAAVQDNSQLW